MTDEEIKEFLHRSFHDLSDLNAELQEKFGLGTYKHYFYDMDKETLAFHSGGPPRVLATIQVAGSVAHTTKTWLWGWANPYFPNNVTKALNIVRAFGETHGIKKLTQEKWAATEEDGWEMTAVCRQLLKARGAYRCPTETGLLFLILTDIARVS